jgi:hypothetical protein
MTALGVALLAALLVFHGRLSGKGSTGAETAGTGTAGTRAARTGTARTTGAVTITAVAIATVTAVGRTGTARTAHIAARTAIITAITTAATFAVTGRTAFTGSGRAHDAGLGGIGAGDDAHAGSGILSRSGLGFGGLGLLFAAAFLHGRQEAGLGRAFRFSREGGRGAALSLGGFSLHHSLGFRRSGNDLGGRSGLGSFDHHSGLGLSLGGHDTGGRSDRLGLHHAGAAGLFGLGFFGGLGSLGSLFNSRFSLGFHRSGLDFGDLRRSRLLFSRRLDSGRGRGRLGATTYDDVLVYIFADNFHRGLRLLHIFEFFRGDRTLGGLLHAKLSQTGHQFGRGNAQLGGGISDFYFFHSYSPYEICA